MTKITNTENLQQYKRRFSLIVEEILIFASSTNLVREVKNMASIFKHIAWQCFKLWIILIKNYVLTFKRF